MFSRSSRIDELDEHTIVKEIIRLTPEAKNKYDEHYQKMKIIKVKIRETNMYLKIGIMITILSSMLHIFGMDLFVIDHQDYEMIMSNDPHYTKYLIQDRLAKQVQKLINSRVSSNHKLLINAFIESTDWDLYEITDKILNYGIDINLTFIKAIKKGKIGAVIKLLKLEIDQRIIKKLNEMLADTNEENPNDPLKEQLTLLLVTEIDSNKLDIKHFSYYKKFRSDWSKSAAKSLKQDFWPPKYKNK